MPYPEFSTGENAVHPQKPQIADAGQPQLAQAPPAPSVAPQAAQQAQPHNAPAGEGQPDALPALFWDASPEEAAENVDQLAMDAMMAELGPAEKALNFKVGAGPLLLKQPAWLVPGAPF